MAELELLTLEELGNTGIGVAILGVGRISALEESVAEDEDWAELCALATAEDEESWAELAALATTEELESALIELELIFKDELDCAARMDEEELA